MDIYLDDSLIKDLNYTDYEIAVYVALRSIYISSRDNQVVSFNMIAYELYANKEIKSSSFESIKKAFCSLLDKGMVSVICNLSANEYVMELKNLFFDGNEKKVIYTVVRDSEVHAIMNINNKMNKFKLLRYYIICLCSLSRTQGIYTDYYGNQKHNYVGFMAQEYLCNKIGIKYESNKKLIQQYNDVLEQNKILYIYKHAKMKRNKITGQFKSFTNHYGRYEDKEAIAKFAIQYEKECGVTEEVVQSQKANNKRRNSARYNNLCWDFDKYVNEYSSDDLIAIYKQISHDNKLIEKELVTTDEGTERYNSLQDKIRDEDIFDKISCVVDYINHKRNPHSSNWGEPDPMENNYTVEEMLDMPTMSEIHISDDLEKQKYIDELEVQRYAEKLIQENGNSYAQSLFVLELMEKYPGLDNYDKYWRNAKMIS
ncbi:hypothetical protein FYJ38_24450 [Clostridium sp. WB02_MRS01]|uniref:hypothetical protein n=1 Tax=Clostridium sp. WB02_MRS01 TaxID=2605777 RepID=UPI0012B27603|nr:hypothetical protein [Clostridium sp. WB02_MRS01]MSS11761.1 hypothetical protein [Clostridium sp. WB02_MRS01]